MNSFVSTLIVACCVISCVSAQYNYQAPAYQQRKLAPVPQAYSPAPAYRPAPKYAPSVYAAPKPVAAYSAPAAPAAYAAPKPAYQEPYHPPSPFAWGYDINDGYGGAQFHKETGDEYGKRTGSYGYTDAYGIYRQVDYVADENGFRAVIKSNEPGVDDKPSSPADVELHHYEPPTNHYAAQEYQKPAYSAAPQQKPLYAPQQQQQQHYQAAPAYRPQQQQYSAPAPTYQRHANKY